jgi:hypothetical protein
VTKWIQWQNLFYSWLLNPVAAMFTTERNVHIFGTFCNETQSRAGMAENKMSNQILE